MKTTSCQPPRATLPRCLALSFLAVWSVCAQNFVRNPDFEDPLGPDNWTIVYTGVSGGGANAPTNCGPYDFLVAGRTTMAHKDMVPGTWDGDPYYWSKFGGHFAPNHSWLMHAYFRQVVRGLKPGSNYVCSAWMAQYTRNDNYLTKAEVYMETLGGPGRSVVRRTPNVYGNVNNNPAGWQRYVVTNTASENGEIEIRLHYNKNGSVAQVWEYRNQNAYYDHVAVVPEGQSDDMPPFYITQFVRTNQEILLSWETVMNNKYRIQVSRDLANPAGWTWVRWSPYLDTNIHAPGTNYTFRTNLLSLFSYDPAFDPNAPLFFRIYAERYVP